MNDEKEFVVYITETLCKKVTVMAKDKDEAIEKISDKYYQSEITLDYVDFSDVDFSAEEVE